MYKFINTFYFNILIMYNIYREYMIMYKKPKVMNRNERYK